MLIEGYRVLGGSEGGKVKRRVYTPRCRRCFGHSQPSQTPLHQYTPTELKDYHDLQEKEKAKKEKEIKDETVDVEPKVMATTPKVAPKTPAPVAATDAALLVALPSSFVRVNAWNWTVGDTLYAGETAGAMQNTIPTGADNIIRVVGFAVNADYIYFYPSQDQQSTIA